MKHILNIEKQRSELHNVFKKIHEGNTILFLGAGASVGEKKYLSKEIIELYEEYLGKQLNENDITKFVDILSADPDFRRTHFDNEVEKLLKKLKPTESHLILARLPWREIITTNYDLLVEQAYDQIRGSSKFLHEIIPIRELKEVNYFSGNNEIKYIKLNGCISDKSKYPLAFSTDDFNNLKSFYKYVLHELKNLSYNIQFISIGYSFKDEFGRKLLDRFDSYNFRDKKWIINVDPYPNENAFHYYTSKKICIIKMSFQNFFDEYEKWETTFIEKKASKVNLTISNSHNNQISIAPHLLLKLSGTINQLNNQYRNKYIHPINFYKGEEPNYNVIIKSLDVIQYEKINKLKKEIEKNLSISQSTLIPLFFISGEFGIGKTTFALRLINELEKDKDFDLVAFEIIDLLNLNKNALIELFEKVSARNIILYCDEVEVDSTFKEIIELRRELSIEQFNESNIFFLIPIRENILEKYKQNRDINELYELRIDGTLSDNEINELLERLKEVGLIAYRDAFEKRQIFLKIKEEYKSDSFISFLSIVTDGKHQNDLIDAYYQLSKIAQQAFIYTALLHRFKLHMPVSILKNVLSIDWDEFMEKVVKIEGKGIFIQEQIDSYGTDTDLYFRTKHPLIAEKLVSIIEPNLDKQYKLYEKIVSSINPGKRNSYLVTNLLRTLKNNSIFSDAKINKLYDRIYLNLSDDPYYLLNYSINLQKRGSEFDLTKALEYLIYAEGLLPRRNHKFTHRRAVINFELAKLYYSNEKELNYTYTYLNEAKELFQIKQIYDPFSAYSYVDYIRLLFWEYENLRIETEEELQIRIKIEELFDVAFSSVTDNISWLHSLKADYSRILKKTTDSYEYKHYLDELYEDIDLRPYACILLYNYYEDQGEKDFSNERDELIEEMSLYIDNNEIVKFLFKYYGQNLHVANNRIKLFEFIRKYPFLSDYYPFRHHYYKFIAESYNHNFYAGKKELDNIKHKFFGLNPEFKQKWNNMEGEPEIFKGIIVKKDRKKYKAVKISSLQQTFRLKKGNYSNYEVGEGVNVILNFYLNGIIAEIPPSP